MNDSLKTAFVCILMVVAISYLAPIIQSTQVQTPQDSTSSGGERSSPIETRAAEYCTQRGYKNIAVISMGERAQLTAYRDGDNYGAFLTEYSDTGIGTPLDITAERADGDNAPAELWYVQTAYREHRYLVVFVGAQSASGPAEASISAGDFSETAKMYQSLDRIVSVALLPLPSELPSAADLTVLGSNSKEIFSYQIRFEQ